MRTALSSKSAAAEVTSYARPCHALNILSLPPPPTHFAILKTGSIVTGTKADQPPPRPEKRTSWRIADVL